MKKYIHIIILAVLGFSFNSCDLDTSPSTAADENIVFSSVENLDRVLNGTWANMMESAPTFMNMGWATLFLTSDAMGSDIAVDRTKYGFGDRYAYSGSNSTIVSTSGTVSLVWMLAYRVIDNMNHIITKIDDLPGNETVKTRIKAQAYALRGYMYLNLGTFFLGNYNDNANALAVPIYLTPTVLPIREGNPRSTLTQVYAQAESDLLNAHGTIGNFSQGSAKHKINSSVISGLLARLYLQKEDWENAEKFAAEAAAPYSWMAPENYLDGFNDVSNVEWMWGHAQTTNQNNAGYNFHYLDVITPGSFYFSFMADPFFKDFFDEDDIRFQLFQWNTTRNPTGSLMYKKFRFRPNMTGDIVMMRKAEMVLIEAEALAEQNKLSEAINKLNGLRNARGAQTPDLSALSQEELVERILIERRKELWGEGFSLSDIKRRRKSVERRAVETGTLVPGTTIRVLGHTIFGFPNGTRFVPNSPFYNFTFPLTETDRNPNWEN
jgi:hypothetical protein